MTETNNKFSKEESMFVLQSVRDNVIKHTNDLKEMQQDLEQYKKEAQKKIDLKESEILKKQSEIRLMETTLEKMERAVNLGEKIETTKRKPLHEKVKEIEKNKSNQTVVENSGKKDLGKTKVYKTSKKSGKSYYINIPNEMIEFFKKNYMNNEWYKRKNVYAELQKAFPDLSMSHIQNCTKEILEMFRDRRMCEIDGRMFKMFKLKISYEGLDEAMKREREVDRTLKR